MPTQNVEVARMLDRVADALAIEGANPFRVRAYRGAAETVRALTRPLAVMLEEGEDLTRLPGIGKDLAKKIEQAVRKGRLGFLERLEHEVPPEVIDLLDIPGLGPKRVRTLWQNLGIETRQDLVRALEEGRVRTLPGFGARTEAGILREIEAHTSESERFLWFDAEGVADDLVRYLKGLDGVKEVVVAGSFRRRRETVGDLDILVTCRRGTKVPQHFIAYEDVQRVLVEGETKTSVRLRSGLQVDLRVIRPVSFGAGLFYFTGSRAHNIALRKMAQVQGLKINEYGVYAGQQRIAGRTEAELYRTFGLDFIAPELREDRGELEAAEKGALPELIEVGDLRGDLHAHTKASDGQATLEVMVQAALERGYEYLAITDHTQATRIAHGLGPEAMGRHLAHIERVARGLTGFDLLRAAEVDILADGTLDLPDSLLDELDLVVCAVHSALRLSREEQTERILRAMDNPYCQILAHPTSRLIQERQPIDVDLERLIGAAAERGCVLELNSQPRRLDLPDRACRAAKEAGVKVAICSDAHSADQLDFLCIGVGIARRGWLEKGDVLNTRPWSEVRGILAS